MGDNSVTVDTLFAAIFDSYSWDDSYMIQQGTEATVYDAVCELDGSQVRLRFSQLYSADIHISEGTMGRQFHLSQTVQMRYSQRRKVGQLPLFLQFRFGHIGSPLV